jgi:xanthine dehydrogenase molybdopterin-binding subunit B
MEVMLALFIHDVFQLLIKCHITGIEMGQGINTKVAQVTAKVLGIPLNKIKVKATNNLVSANSFGTVGAITSELVSYVSSTIFKSQIVYKLIL